MPWATDEAGRADFQHARLEASVPHWDEGSEYCYVVLVDGRVVGSMGLHARIGPRALELGYWLQSDHTGRGITATCAGALTAVGLTLPTIERVEIHCDEANQRSASIPRRLGYRLARVEADDVSAPAEIGRTMIWVYPPGAAEPALTDSNPAARHLATRCRTGFPSAAFPEAMGSVRGNPRS
jgi:RimJ/RimL family protein N-acetyltransferase